MSMAMRGARFSSSKRSGGERNSAGFTLIELLVVVAIIGILAAIALAKIQQAIVTAKQGRTVAHLDSMRSALQMYFLDHGEDANSYYPWQLHQIAKEYPEGNPAGCGTHGGLHWYIVQIPFEEVGDGPRPGNQITDWCNGPDHAYCKARTVQGADKGGWNWCIPGGAGSPTAAPSGTVWIDEDCMMFGGKNANQY